ncbi:MAG: single-stranded-DNA-specific exonuclease RecJ [Sulfobacillus benefaciens]|uniref:Single-stranded-DNA-specific exonuclease RecJ n=1 Tax=Sulfobacillus benefaciens TaxID=453960 RepID=A0A2T2XHR3_9FIRM|nr:MAG: single-stranded-DNA-specific exonuclease RecJ [Sulfobacillus benefaciens]
MKNFQYPVWTARDAEEVELLARFARECEISAVTAQVLWRRGVKTREAYGALIQQSETLSSPFELPDMDLVVKHLHEAKQHRQKIRVYGDYDADGVTATAVMVRGLETWGMSGLVDYYIPNRFDEGYGLNVEAVMQAAADKIPWMITVDCGSSSPEAAETARQLGIRLMITDHHGLPLQLPQAMALVNPERMSEPNRLSGAGVALQVIRALLEENTPKWCYGVAAIGTVADVVPLVGDNRTLVQTGLTVLKRGLVPGVNALMAAESRDVTAITAEDLGFLVGPQLNAAGRMGDADLAVRTLLSEDDQEAVASATQLQGINQARRRLERDITDRAWDWIAQTWTKELPPFVVVAGDNWHHGVIGITASRLKETLRRPVAVIGWESDTGKGSARGIDGLHLLYHMRRHADRFSKLGGHQGAAGFSLPRQDPVELSYLLSEDFPAPALKQLRHGPILDWEGPASRIDKRVVTELSRLEPFGHGFERPHLMLNGVVGDVWTMGKEHQHLALAFQDHDIKAVAFGRGDMATACSPKTGTRVVAKLVWNSFRGRTQPQWLVDDIVTPWALGDIFDKVRWQEPPNFLTGRIIIMVSDTHADWPLPRIGDNRLTWERAMRGQLTRISVDVWQPWPRLVAWADHVVWDVHPPSRVWLNAAATLLGPDGVMWVNPEADRTAVERHLAKMVPDRDRLARHWRRWKQGVSPFMVGRAIFRELGLDARSGESTKVSLDGSVQYCNAQILWQDYQDCKPYPVTEWENLSKATSGDRLR